MPVCVCVCVEPRRSANISIMPVVLSSKCVCVCVRVYSSHTKCAYNINLLKFNKEFLVQIHTQPGCVLILSVALPVLCPANVNNLLIFAVDGKLIECRAIYRIENIYNIK